MSIRKRKSLINIIRQDKALVILASLLCLIIIHLLFYSILLYKEAGAALQILILPTPTPTPIQFVVPNNLLVPPQPISTPTPTPTPSQGILPLGTTAPQETVTPLAEPQPTPTPPVRGTPVVSPPNPTPTPVVNSPTFTPSPVVRPTATPTPVVAPIAAPTPSPTPQVAPVAVPTPDAAQSASVGLLSVLEGYEIIDFIKQTIFYNSGLKKLIEKIIVPSLVIIALLNTFPSILATGINLRIWLHLLFVEPFLWLFKKRREKWNVVYDALSKRPVDLAVVRLYDKKNNKIIQEKVTDGNGRYLLRVNENGEYYLTAQKTGYVYPSRLLKGRTQDNKYSYLYFGKEIKLAEQGGDIVVDIPLDPVEKKLKSANWLIGEYWLKNFRLAVSYSGIILAVVAVIIVPTVITISCLILHVILLWIFRRLNVAPKIKNWGVIYDQENKAPLVHAIVRIFDLEFNRLVANQLTDAQGKYAFLVGENKFQVLAEKPDYEKKIIKPVDLTGKKQIIDLDIGLKKNN